jgi:hypothetical protein
MTSQWISDGLWSFRLEASARILFSYGFLYHSIDIRFAILVLDIDVLFFMGSLPRTAKVFILGLISDRNTVELNVNSPLHKSPFFFGGRSIKTCKHLIMSSSDWTFPDNHNNGNVMPPPRIIYSKISFKYQDLEMLDSSKKYQVSRGRYAIQKIKKLMSR